MIRTVLVAAQFGTFISLGVLFLATGSWRLGLAQVLLGAVTVLVYAA